MIVLIIVTSSIFNIICFFLGAKIGQMVVKNEPIQIESPIQKIENHFQKKEEDKNQEIMETISHNIDVYDGTSIGQKDIPR